MNRVEQDCTARCHSTVHAAQIVAAITKGSSSEIKAFCRWLCHNFTCVLDSNGRNALHAAASCNKWEVVQWLLQQCGVAVDIRDSESGWTALHRSLFYGQLTAARLLLMHGASLHITDREGLSPLDLVTRDRLPHVEYLSSSPLEVYIWGPNSNFNLGLDNEQGRANPELLEYFRCRNINIQQVCMCEFHTIFLSRDNRVFTCGHGQGGRLGQKTEKTCLSPAPVKDLGDLKCIAVAGAVDHTVLLLEGGQVWTCGLNSYHQLGHVPPPERLLSPRPISPKLLSRHTITGICAARYHTVLYAADGIYSFGLNAGQLGHPKGDRTQVVPRLVSAFHQKNWDIVMVAASDGATVCTNSLGDVFLLANYQCRKIATRWLNMKKICVIGGHLDPHCNLSDGGGSELKIALLSKPGKVYLWTETNAVFTKCTFLAPHQLIFSDLHASQSSFAMVTLDGEGFIGQISKKQALTKPIRSESSAGSPVKKGNLQLAPLVSPLEKEEFISFHVKRLPFVFRATCITSDPKGKNFASLQAVPIIGVYDLPSVSSSDIQEQFMAFLEEADAADNFHDVVIQVGTRRFPGHRYILASRSEFFRKKMAAGERQATEISVEGMADTCFECLQKFLYCNTCDFLVNGKQLAWIKTGHVAHDEELETKKQASGVPKAILDGCQKLGLTALRKRLESVKVIGGRVLVGNIDPLPRLKFSRKVMSDLCDIIICSKDGVKFHCHRCILVARSEYFRGMLAPVWFEASSPELKLPLDSKILDIVLDYIYTDEAAKLQGCDDVEFLCTLLAVTDQMLMVRLMEMVELNLVDLITLKNVTDLLQLSVMCNSKQLHATCLQYICINLSALLESGSLERLDEESIEDLTSAYKRLIPTMSRRIITPYSDWPHREELEKILHDFPMDDTVTTEKPTATPTRGMDHKLKFRRSNTQTVSENVKTDRPNKATASVCEASSVSKEDQMPDAKPSPPKDIKTDSTSRSGSVKTELTTPTSIKDICNWPHKMVSRQQPPDLRNIIEQEQASNKLPKKSPEAKWDGKLERLSQKQRKRLNRSIGSDNSDESPSITTSPEPSPRLTAWATVPYENNGNFQKPPETDPRPVRSAWQTKTNATCPDSEVPSLSLILQKEQELLQRRQQTAKPKSLLIIDIEEQAVEELLKLYNAHNNPDERITVEHIVPEKMAPVWKKHA